jgi:hypothetical protein
VTPRIHRRHRHVRGRCAWNGTEMLACQIVRNRRLFHCVPTNSLHNCPGRSDISIAWSLHIRNIIWFYTCIEATVCQTRHCPLRSLCGETPATLIATLIAEPRSPLCSASLGTCLWTFLCGSRFNKHILVTGKSKENCQLRSPLQARTRISLTTRHQTTRVKKRITCAFDLV